MRSNPGGRADFSKQKSGLYRSRFFVLGPAGTHGGDPLLRLLPDYFNNNIFRVIWYVSASMRRRYMPLATTAPLLFRPSQVT